MRHTPLLDRCGITFKVEVPDHAVNVIDAALQAVEGLIDWGEHEGRKRKPCEGQPLLLAGMPLGQYHCEVCGVMGRDWPSGYYDTEANPS